jgi:hypothetical protein
MKRFLLSLIFLFIAINFLMAQHPVIWQRTYGEQPYNYGLGVIQLDDDGYIFLADENGNIGNANIHLIRTDSLGIIKWERIVGDNVLRWGNDFKQTSDKGYIIAGYTYQSTLSGYDLMLIKTDSLGQIQWEKNVGGTDWDFGEAVMITPDTGFLVVGKTYSYGAGDADAYIVKFNNAGDTMWTRTMGGDSLDFAVSCDIAPDSNYWIAANTTSFGKGSQDAWIIKFSPQGDTLWSHFYGDTLEDRVNAFKTTPDKGFVFVGYTDNYGSINKDVWLVRIDSNMNFMWKLPEFWNIGPGEDVALDVSLNDSAQFVISGYTNGAGMGGYDMKMMVMAEWNIFKYNRNYGSLEDDETYKTIQTHDKGYIMLGTSNGMGPSNTNLFVIKTKPNCDADTTCYYTIGIAEDNLSQSMEEFNIFPNPSSGNLNITINQQSHAGDVRIRVFNVSGICVKQFDFSDKSPANYYSININDQPGGLYLIEVTVDENRWVQKIILQ